MVRGTGSTDIRALRRSLAQNVRGDVHVDRRGAQVCVAPYGIADVAAIMHVAREHNCSVAADDRSTPAEIVVFRSPSLHRIHTLDAAHGRLVVEAGVLIGELRRMLASEGCALPAAATLRDDCTLGAAIDADLLVGSRAGATVPAYDALQIVTGDGDRLRLEAGELASTDGVAEASAERLRHDVNALRVRDDAALRNVAAANPRLAGYRLAPLLDDGLGSLGHLLSGARNTLALVVSVSAHVEPLAPRPVSAVFGFASAGEAAANAPFILSYDPVLAMLIGEAHRAVLPAALPAGKAWIAVEFGGDATTAAATAVSLVEAYHRRIGEPAAVVLHGHVDDGWRKALRRGPSTRIRCPLIDLGEFVDALTKRAGAAYTIDWRADLRAADVFVDTMPADAATRARLIDDILALSTAHRAQLVPGAFDDSDLALVTRQAGPEAARLCLDMRGAFDPASRLHASAGAFFAMEEEPSHAR